MLARNEKAANSTREERSHDPAPLSKPASHPAARIRDHGDEPLRLGLAEASYALWSPLFAQD